MIGAKVFTGTSRLLSGPLGVVRIAFNGYDLGKTTADAILKPDQDVKDILFQQEGTKAADQVRTGMKYVLSATFGEIATGLLVALMSGFTTKNTNTNADSASLGRNIFKSMRANEAKVLKIFAVDENGVALETAENVICFYEAIPVINGDLINWGADTQRNVPVEFHIFHHTFAQGESTTKVGAFGYIGNPVTEDVPPVVWPNVSAPVPLSAAVTLATSATVTFDEAVTAKGGVTIAERFAAYVSGDLKKPTSVAFAGAVATLTFAAGTFSTGKVVKIIITEDSVVDASGNANMYGMVNATNPL